MNRDTEDELVNLLGEPPIQPIPEQNVQVTARNAALDAYRQKHSGGHYKLQRNLLLAAVLLLTGFIGGMFLRPKSIQVSPGTAPLVLSSDAYELLRQGQSLFDNQIEAVVIKSNDTDYVLSSGQRNSTAPWYLIQFVDPVTNQTVSVIGTSGSRFSIASDREAELLQSGDGQFIVTGHNYIIQAESTQAINPKAITL